MGEVLSECVADMRTPQLQEWQRLPTTQDEAHRKMTKLSLLVYVQMLIVCTENAHQCFFSLDVCDLKSALL